MLEGFTYESEKSKEGQNLRSGPLNMPPKITIARTERMMTNVPMTSFRVIVVPTMTLANTKLTIRAKLPRGATHYIGWVSFMISKRE
jgi:hypothetical protein